MSEEGVEPDLDKVVKVKSWPRPANGKQVHELFWDCWVLSPVCEEFCMNC